MRRRALRSALAVATIGAIVALWPAAPASAHPLGNFTVNVYDGIVVRTDSIVVDYVVDMAEIPAFREQREIDANRDDRVDGAESIAYRERTCGSVADGISVRVDDRPVPVAPTDVHALSFPKGAGGLSTLRLECRLKGAISMDTSGVAISYEDRNFSETIGWREVTVVGDGVTLAGASVPATSVTDRLTSYPQGALSPEVRAASVSATPGGERLAILPGPGAQTRASSSTIQGRDGGLLASLVGRDDLTPLLVAAMIVVAVGIGALHALGPGHGKTLIGAYLVGAGGSIRHAVGVGAAVSVMHTASVLTLGLLVLSAERLFAPERVYPVLGLASGLIALGLGSALLVSRIHSVTAGSSDDDHAHHVPGRAHQHGHGASAEGSPLSRRGMLALAFSGGILPSPSALVVLLASVTLGRTALGLVLIAAFSVGLAGALIGVGVLTLQARGVAERRLSASAARLLPIGSAAAIAAMGLFLTVRGAIQL
ncbi:MAG: hypothetical protein OEW52_02550 [Thermoleophilia bacterium]|nr:hypothetical protein [Actinomycetota bacterium]MDH5224049.1 hypothetical protein [Actinomycetota bacterium]MDH5280012.1 hypothetical protein [Thermoleophilia bacterium]